MKKMKEVCLVEDDKVQIFLLQKFLEKCGQVETVHSYENGKAAYLEMEKRQENGNSFPDLIFLDINMPIWDGWEFYEAFIGLKGHEKVTLYILTSSLSEDDFQKARSFGLEERYLQKPLAYPKLEEIINSLHR